MSHRTRHLPEAHNPVHRVIREMRYHEPSRQLLALAFAGLVAAVGGGETVALYWSGLTIAAVGMLVRLWASGHVVKNRELATNGPYALARHPLYVGNILLLFGFAIASHLWWTFPLILVFLWFYYPTAVEYEDLKLHRKFGEQWEQWAARTPALLPAAGTLSRAGGSWSFRQSLMGNGEPLIAVYLVFCGWYLVAL